LCPEGSSPGMLVVLFKIRNCSQGTVLQLAGIQMLSPVNSGRPSDIDSVVTVHVRKDA